MNTATAAQKSLVKAAAELKNEISRLISKLKINIKRAISEIQRDNPTKTCYFTESVY